MVGVAVVVGIPQGEVGGTDELAVLFVAVREAKAEEPEADRSQASVHQVFVEDILHVFDADAARFEHGETSLHDCARRWRGGVS